MRRMLGSLLFALLLVATGASAQSLWNGSEFGMTVKQVLAVIPNASRPKEPKHLGDGSEELLRLEGVEIVNREFDASFFFNGGKLRQVTLSLQEPRNFADAMRVFDNLTEALRSKYGQEITRDVRRGHFGNDAQATWLSGRTNIAVLAMSAGDDFVVLNVNYQVRVASESDKL